MSHLSLRHLCGNFVSAALSLTRLSLMKIFLPQSIFFSLVERLSPNVVIDVDSASRLKLGYKVSVHSGGRITSLNGGRLSIGNGCGINVNCIITCRHEITIGERVAIGPNVQMFDHNHSMVPGKSVKESEYTYKPITIGDDCWIGAGVIILAGSRIGNRCVIGAGSVVSGIVPDNTMLIQKRESIYKSVE